MVLKYCENDKGKKKRYRGYELTIATKLADGDSVCGVTSFKNAKEKDFDEDSKYDILSYDNEFYRVKPKPGKDLFPRYIKVSCSDKENTYLRLKHDWLLLPILLCMLFALVITTVFISRGDKGTDGGYVLSQDGSTWDGNPYQNSPEASQETTSIIVPNDLYVSAKKKFVKFINPPENTVYLKFTVYDLDGNMLAETGDVAPGNSVENVDLYSVLEHGEHSLRIRVDSHDVETLEECQGTYIDTTITVD